MKEKAVKFKFCRIISCVLTLGVVFSIIPSAIAEDGYGNVRTEIKLTEPTPERVFCAVNDIVEDWYILTSDSYLNAVVDSEGRPVSYAELVSDDGTIHPAALSSIADWDEYSGSYVSYNIYDLLYSESESIYNSFASISEDFTIDYSSRLKFYNECVIGEIFGGNANPPAMEVFEFIFGDTFRPGDDGYAFVVKSDYITDSDGFFLWMEDVIDPNGVYINKDERFGGYKNVYAQLKALRDEDKLTPEAAFEILTGYAADIDGYLYTATDILCNALDKNGNKVKLAVDLLNSDYTVGSTDMQPREYALSVMRNVLSGVELDFVDIPDGTAEVLKDYIPSYDEIMAMLEDDLDEHIEMMEEIGVGKKCIAVSVLEYVLRYDNKGYLVDYWTSGYAVDADGNHVNIRDIMDSDGNFVTNEFGAKSVWELIDAYIETVNVDMNLMGDVNGDGQVNIIDASLMLKKIAGWDIEIDEVSGDVRKNDRITIPDVMCVLQYIAGWNVYFDY